MSERRFEPEFPDELEHADELLEKAEALIRKHQGGSDSLDDLPVLTDVVELDPAPAEPPAAAQAESPVATGIDESLLVERLIGLDAKLSLAIEQWVASELPQILSREFDAMSERIREEAIAHLRATLIPGLSQDISAMLDPEEPGPP